MILSKAFQLLFEKDIITAEQFKILQSDAQKSPISIHWEINTLLLVGVSLLSGGLGTLVYKNIDTIGHAAIIFLIALVTAACGWYVFKKRQPFLVNAIQKEQTLPDNMLLLGCSLFLILEGYLQYQYQMFGTRYGLATLIPAILFFLCAYRFDHIGVLTIAMTAFVSWLGLSATPLSIFREDVFQHEPILVHTGIIAGSVLIIAGWVLNNRQIKPHFTFSYLNFGFNLVCIASLYGAFNISAIPYSMLCLAFCILAVLYARREHSYFFLLAGVIYGYIAFTTIISQMNWLDEIWLFYGLASCLGIVLFFLNFKKLLK